MSIGSERVKEWRKTTKDRIINAFDGRCGICGYNKSTFSLHLHHVDPSKKEFSFGAVRASCSSWDKLVVELRKCVLLCANCHGEVHEGVTLLPEKMPTFNEKFADYKNLDDEQKVFSKRILDKCPICGKEKSIFTLTCGKGCSARKKGSVDWPKFDSLVRDASKSDVFVASQIGCSGAAVWKRRKKLNI
jgi:Zn finger protein HypA/HybF involved in hydrogenase expression